MGATKSPVTRGELGGEQTGIKELGESCARDAERETETKKARRKSSRGSGDARWK